MKKILNLIEQRKGRLEESAFCRWLAGGDSGGEDRFAFVPSQMFLVLGFRDILSFLKVPSPKTELELQINVHCQEDSDHWKWYLQDLETLGFTLPWWGDSVSDVTRRMWSQETYSVRCLVYLSIHYVQQHRDPLISLALIEVLEAAFGAFIKHMSVEVRRQQLSEHLQYYGKTHVDKENSHAMGSWADDHGPETALMDYEMTDAQGETAIKMVNDLFTHFDTIFDGWYNARTTAHFFPRRGVTAGAGLNV